MVNSPASCLTLIVAYGFYAARNACHDLGLDPPIFADFRRIIREQNPSLDLAHIERFAFYEAAGSKDVTLTIASGDQRLYANILLTIGVVT